MRRKTEVYTWRVSAALKESLEEAARVEGRSVSRLLDDIVAEHLRRGAGDGSESERQRRLHARASPFAGSIRSGRADRASKVRELVRARLSRRHGAR